MRALWDRSLPPPVADEGRRSVGNHKERLKAATMCVPRRMKAGGTSGNGKERLRDDSVSRPEIPNVFNREAIKEKVVRKRSEP